MIKTLLEIKQSFLKYMQIRVLSANLEAEIQKNVAFSLILGNTKRQIMNSGKSKHPLRTCSQLLQNLHCICLNPK